MLRNVDWYLVKDVSEQSIGSIFKDKADWRLKMGPIGSSETSVTKYQSTLRNVQEERRSDLMRSFKLLHNKVHLLRKCLETLKDRWL
jgi:hypothetical protein